MGLNLPQQVRSVRLVNEDGIIRRETFYKYLMVWCSMDYLGYTFSQVTSVYIYHDISFHTHCKNCFSTVILESETWCIGWR